eukprot:6207595-Pleurochrysis_carterae.AAC.3
MARQTRRHTVPPWPKGSASPPYLCHRQGISLSPSRARLRILCCASSACRVASETASSSRIRSSAAASLSDAARSADTRDTHSLNAAAARST